MLSKNASLFSISFAILIFFEHNRSLVQAAEQISADVFILPNTGEIYSNIDYDDFKKSEWTDITYKEKKVDREDYLEYEEKLKRLGRIHSILSAHSENTNIPIQFLNPDEYLEYIQNNVDDKRFFPMNTFNTDMENEPLEYGLSEAFSEEEKSDYKYLEYPESENIQYATASPEQVNSNSKVLKEDEFLEVNINNAIQFDSFEDNNQSLVNKGKNSEDFSLDSENKLLPLDFTESDTFINKNSPEDTLNMNDYDDDLSPEETKLLDEVMAQKDIQDAMVQEKSLSDTSLKNILYSIYNSSNRDVTHSSDENSINFKQVSIPTNGQNLTTQDNLSFNTNNTFQIEYTPKNESDSQSEVNQQFSEESSLDTNDTQQYSIEQVVKMIQGTPSESSGIPNESIRLLPSIYPNTNGQKDGTKYMYPIFSIESSETILMPAYVPSNIERTSSAFTTISDISNTEQVYVSDFNTLVSYPTQILSLQELEPDIENTSTLELDVLQSVNSINNTLESGTLHPETSKPFDSSVQVKHPNGGWSPSCKNIHKGMYCMEPDGESSAVVECFGENIGFQFLCGSDMFCYSVSAYDVDCRPRA